MSKIIEFKILKHFNHNSPVIQLYKRRVCLHHIVSLNFRFV